MKSDTYRNYLLTVLLVIQTFNYLDGTVLGLVLQNIKTDLHLSDTQLGFLGGLSFAVFYSVMGIPIARWADRGNRVTIISLAAAVWSIMVPLCGLAASFAQLVLIRVGVAVGEAGCNPPAHSLIADNFSRAERPRAVAIYLLGGGFSTLIGYFLGGWLNQLYGWRTTFIALGLPGLIPAAFAALTLKEPRRERPPFERIPSERNPSKRPGKSAAAAEPQPDFRQACAMLWSNITFRHLMFSYSVMCLFAYGILQWQPAFFIRSYGLNTGELGTWFALIYGVGGILGTYWGGVLASRYTANNERLQLKVMAIIYSSFGIISALIYLLHDRYWVFGLMALASLGGAAANGPLFATIQTVVPSRLRAVSISMIYLLANLIGMGLGPLAAGALSDALRPFLGEESLRYALLALCPGYLWGAWHLWLGSKTVTRDIQATQEECGESPDDSSMPDTTSANISVA